MTEEINLIIIGYFPKGVVEQIRKYFYYQSLLLISESDNVSNTIWNQAVKLHAKLKKDFNKEKEENKRRHEKAEKEFIKTMENISAN